MAIKFAAKDQPKSTPVASVNKPDAQALEREADETREAAGTDLFNSESKAPGRKPKSK